MAIIRIKKMVSLQRGQLASAAQRELKIDRDLQQDRNVGLPEHRPKRSFRKLHSLKLLTASLQALILLP